MGKLLAIVGGFCTIGGAVLPYRSEAYAFADRTSSVALLDGLWGYLESWVGLWSVALGLLAVAVALATALQGRSGQVAAGILVGEGMAVALLFAGLLASIIIGSDLSPWRVDIGGLAGLLGGVLLITAGIDFAVREGRAAPG
jgi:hypothetical protein